MQSEAAPEDQLIFSVVGWHALTLPQDPRKLLQTRNDTFATLVAIGLDPERSIIFHQDQVCRDESHFNVSNSDEYSES